MWNPWIGSACSVMSNSVTPWTVAHQAPLSMEFSRHGYWSGLPFLPPGNPPHPGIEPTSSTLADGFFIICAPWEALWIGRADYVCLEEPQRGRHTWNASVGTWWLTHLSLLKKPHFDFLLPPAVFSMQPCSSSSQLS